MKISELIEQLESAMREHGDVQVTCTAALQDDDKGPIPNVFESTIETLAVREGGSLGTRVRLYL